MFSDKKEKDTKKYTEVSSKQNRINQGTAITGDITSSGFFRIDGTVEGTISSPSKIVLGKLGKIEGKLICENADIEGCFEGELHVSGILSLKSTARILGEVTVGKLMVEPGATFNGTCKMQDSKLGHAAKKNNKPVTSRSFESSETIQKSTAGQN
ncbi:MAG: bactofilin family protein [Marinirhabdus sp.]